MVFNNYKTSNNADSRLLADITASANLILITNWDEDLFPSTFPYLLTIEHLDTNKNVITREIVKVNWSNQNSLIVTRWAGTCVQDDTASPRVQSSTPHAFSAWDKISLYWTSEQVQDIVDKVWLSGNSDSIANLYSSSSTYNVWDIVMYDWERYRCITNISSPEAFNPAKWTKIPVQTDINTIKTDVQTLNDWVENVETNWILTPRLSQKVYVWEYYTSSDSVYLQHLPTEANSWLIAYAVWDNVARTNIHIQRIWSWTLSNTLKLKIRSIWSPTTRFVCKIQRWTTVSVSATETAWYWNWNTIATADLPYTNFSHEWSTVTFTFDNFFGGTAWELLDIVVGQQDDIVNSVAYYEIAIDSTQFWEGQRLIAVNWTSRTYSKLMPYAESSGFLYYSLAKVQTATYTGSSAVVQLSQDFAWATSSGYWSVTYSPSPFSVNTTFLRWSVIFSPTYQRLQTSMAIWGTTIFSWVYWTPQSWENTKAASDTISFSWYKNSWGSTSFRTELTFYYYLTQNVSIAARYDKPLVLPISVWSVGQQMEVTLFGLIWDTWWNWGYV